MTSNMTSLVVFNLTGKLTGKEKEIVAVCREQNFGIWTTLSDPAQIRIGILNQLSENAITEIVERFADTMLKLGGDFSKDNVLKGLADYYSI